MKCRYCGITFEHSSKIVAENAYVLHVMKEHPQSKMKIAIETEGMPINEQEKLVPVLKLKKYQVDILTHDGRKRFLYANDPELVKAYCNKTGAKILKIHDLQSESKGEQ